MRRPPPRAVSAALAGILVTAALAAAAGGGWLARAATSPPVAPADSAGAVVLARPEGRPVLERPVQDGNLWLRPLSYACRLTAVFGTHAELQPHGAYCSVQTEIRNAGGEAHTFDARQQEIVLADGRRFTPDPSAMAVRRQALQVELGGHQRLWLELWFDLPTGAVAVAVALRGDGDPPAFLATAPARRTPGGVVFGLPA